jgi:succinate-semialdehyde dehydrogenase / glutarate-semialdehyde dehydrogenase
MGKRTFPVFNPASGDVIAQVPDMEAEDAERAIDAASCAFPLWRDTPPKKRGDILCAWAAKMEQNLEELAGLMTREQGKPLSEARAEILAGAQTLYWCAAEGQRLYGEFIDGPSGRATKIIISKEPVGVVGAITPWNFPVGMVTRKVGPALAAGCTVVLKPAEGTPLCALALAKMGQEAGLPQGVLNVVTTEKPKIIGMVLTSDTRVKKISFTGSTQVGKQLIAQAAGHVQRISLELGGNAPFIVFANADMEKAVDGAIQSKFRNAGQTCICANRIFVESSIYDAFLAAFTRKVEALNVGAGDAAGTDIGPLINRAAIEKIETMVQDAVKGGARLVLGGKRHILGQTTGGHFFEQTIMTGAKDTDSIACSEIFGPVAVLYRFESEEEVIERANGTPYGLAAYLYSQDMAQIWRVSDALEFGMIGVNKPILANDLAPFGGVKESGIGKEGGQYGLLEYLNIKYRLLG